MPPSTAPDWSAIDAQQFAAAESMLQHSRSARSNSRLPNGFLLPDVQRYSHDAIQGPPPPHPLTPPAFSNYRHPFQTKSVQEHASSFGAPFEGKLPSPLGLQSNHNRQKRDSFSELSRGRSSDTSVRSHMGSLPDGGSNAQDTRNGGDIDDSEPTSPVSTRGYNRRHLDKSGNWMHRSATDFARQQEIKDESDIKPSWSELKTKAGKERKRLPLACIACRRKKIRCSGEKPACKHCMRSRIPCVYKVTQRKAAPRTDYMAMLDKRLKRMEERIIKIIPKDEKAGSSTIPRAIIRPLPIAHPSNGKKRAAGEAFGSPLDEWAGSKARPASVQGQEGGESKVNTEGAEFLPSAEIQDHLSEVFFDHLYGQSYHLLHKPSYMKKLRAGTVPPVLILAVCAISARFSTHPQVAGEPAFLRGECWAGPARTIALRRYDEPNITTLTVLVLLGLHEFGTCQGGRSWMFAGMATRMAYALQLHRELDHDPLGRNPEKPSSELSFTDREIRRRTMWACFLMDRFNSSGTERPMFADEETIKIQLPIRESNFQMEIPGPTETLDGRVPNPSTSDNGQLLDPRENMGVAAYMVRIVALWGRVIKYLNMGGKERDPYPIWDSESGFAKLRQEANTFRTSLPSNLDNTPENLKIHAAEKLGNQFLFLHIASYQTVLFLNRFAIPTAPGARNPKDMPASFLNEAGPAAVDAAQQISSLISEAWDHHAVAPFLGYCAFLSSTINVWAIFSRKEPRIAELSKKHLATNVKYLGKMKKYWGMFHFMLENLKDIYRQHADASARGSREATGQGDTIFQYGDWFQKYPHGVSGTDYQDPVVRIKRDPDEDVTLSHNYDLQSVEEFFHTKSPPSRTRDLKKSAKTGANTPTRSDTLQPPTQQPDCSKVTAQQGMLPLHVNDSQSAVDQSPFVAQQSTQLYPQPCVNSFPQAYDLLPLSSPINTGLLPQLDRHLVYGAYAGQDPTGSSSASVLSAMTNSQQDASSALSDPSNQMWDNSLDLTPQRQQQQQFWNTGDYMGDMQTSAWFMPFNLDPHQKTATEMFPEGSEVLEARAASGWKSSDIGCQPCGRLSQGFVSSEAQE